MGLAFRSIIYANLSIQPVNFYRPSRTKIGKTAVLSKKRLLTEFQIA